MCLIAGNFETLFGTTNQRFYWQFFDETPVVSHGMKPYYPGGTD